MGGRGWSFFIRRSQKPLPTLRLRIHVRGCHLGCGKVRKGGEKEESKSESESESERTHGLRYATWLQSNQDW